MKIYIAGPITKGGTVRGEQVLIHRKAFADVAARLRARGHVVINPVEVHPVGDVHEWSYEIWRRRLRTDITLLVTCDAIYLLPGWEESRGARLEAHVARELGMATTSL